MPESAPPTVVASAAPRDAATVYDCFDRLRFPLILLVIYIHNAAFEVTFADGRAGSASGPLMRFLVDFLSNGVARTAVPLFFFMSGFLFFYRSRFDRAAYGAKLRGRTYTLLIPYLIWNGLNYLFYFVAQSNPLTAPWFGGSVPTLPRLSGWDSINVLLGLQGFPIAYQFWFIRDLMILVILTPLFWLVARSAGAIAGTVLAVLGVLWIMLAWSVTIPSVESVFFFYLGSYCAIRQVPILAWRRQWWMAASACAAFFALSALQLSPAISRLASCAAVSLALVAALGWSSRLSAQAAAVLTRLAPASFFTFAVHEPLLQIARKLLYRTVPMSPGSAIALYLLLPLAIAGLTLVLFAVVRRTMPQCLAWATGKRS